MGGKCGQRETKTVIVVVYYGTHYAKETQRKMIDEQRGKHGQEKYGRSPQGTQKGLTCLPQPGYKKRHEKGR